MNIFFVYVTALTVAVQTSSINAEEAGIQVVLKHCTCFGNNKYVDKILSPRKPVNRTTSITSTDLYFKPNVSLDSPLYVHVNAYKKFATQYKPFMLNLKAEACETLKLKSHPMYRLFAQMVGDKEHESNILEPCPMKGHRYVKPYYTNYESLPSLLPTGMWRIDIKLTKGLQEDVAGWTSFYEIIAKGIDEF